MAVSATADVENVTVTATHAATGMTDNVTVNVDTLRDQFYLFQATPAAVTTVTYTNGDGEARTLTTNSDGLLAVYEPSGIDSDVQFRSGDEDGPLPGHHRPGDPVQRGAGRRQAAALPPERRHPGARRPGGALPGQARRHALCGRSVTLRGGVYLGGYYCEVDSGTGTKNSVSMGPDSDHLSPATRTTRNTPPIPTAS